MSTSLSSGEIRYSYAELGADRAVSTALMRDVIDTALHKADQAAQVRLNWVAPAAAVWTAGGEPHVSIYGDQEAGGLDTSTEDVPLWYRFGVRSFYAPKVRAGGQGYQLRIRLAGASSDGGTVNFAVIVQPGRASTLGTFYGMDPASGTVPVAIKRYSGITATTPSYLTPDDGLHVLTIPRVLIDAAYALESAYTTDVDLGGAETAVVIPSLTIVPIALTLTADTVPVLYACHAAEFVGET